LRRREELLGAGYLPAIATRASVDPATAEGREQWWDEHFAGGEYAHEGGIFPNMPDYSSPSMSLVVRSADTAGPVELGWSVLVP
jgi:hypothetical protein